MKSHKKILSIIILGSISSLTQVTAETSAKKNPTIQEYNCLDGVDNDRDGSTDIYDTDCIGSVEPNVMLREINLLKNVEKDLKKKVSTASAKQSDLKQINEIRASIKNLKSLHKRNLKAQRRASKKLAKLTNKSYFQATTRTEIAGRL